MAVGAERRREPGISRWTMDLVAGPFLLAAFVFVLALSWVVLMNAAAPTWMILAIVGIVISIAVLFVHDVRRLRRGLRGPRSPF